MQSKIISTSDGPPITRIMQCICKECWEKHKEILGKIFSNHYQPDCTLSWHCLYCKKPSRDVATRNIRMVKKDIENYNREVVLKELNTSYWKKQQTSKTLKTNND